MGAYVYIIAYNHKALVEAHAVRRIHCRPSLRAQKLAGAPW